MRKILLIAVIAALGFNAWQRISGPAQDASPGAFAGEAPPGSANTANAAELQVERSSDEPQKFSCDGRVYCSQMTSCEEARYFLQHCPGVKMDGEGDGIPCEKQWCGRQ